MVNWIAEEESKPAKSGCTVPRGDQHRGNRPSKIQRRRYRMSNEFNSFSDKHILSARNDPAIKAGVNDVLNLV